MKCPSLAGRGFSRSRQALEKHLRKEGACDSTVVGIQPELVHLRLWEKFQPVAQVQSRGHLPDDYTTVPVLISFPSFCPSVLPVKPLSMQVSGQTLPAGRVVSGRPTHSSTALTEGRLVPKRDNPGARRCGPGAVGQSERHPWPRL